MIRRLPMSVANRTRAALASRYVRNVGWLGGAEMSNRVTRLGATVVLARCLDPAAFGLAAVAITAHELIKVGAQIGAGQAIVRADDASLEAVCKTANRLNWAICGALAGVQAATGLALAAMLGRPELAAMGALLSLIFLGMPFGLVRIFRAKRAQRLDKVARIQAAQVGADNILTAVLALAGLGPWAIVAPKALTFPIWLFGALRADNWRPDPAIAPAPMRPMLRYGLPILGAESVAAARMHLDKAIVGGVLGIEALGVYFFAYNAGLGLSQTVSTAFSGALYPHLCAERAGAARRARFDRAMLVGGSLALAILLTQAAAAPLYVPIVFGAEWAFAIPVLVVLCLAAGPRMIADAANQLARAEGATDAEFAGAAFTAAAMLGALALAAPYGLLAGAAAYTAAAWLSQPAFAAFIRYRAAPRAAGCAACETICDTGRVPHGAQA